MNDSQLDARLGRWLADGPTVAPVHLARGAAAFAVAHPRTRRDWRGLLAGAGTLVRPMPVAMRPIALLILLGLTFAIGAFAYAAWHNGPVVPQPSPTIQPSPAPAGYVCPPGSSADQPGPTGQQWPWTGVDPDIGWGPMVFDATSGELLVIDRAPMSIWAFDVCHNTWSPTGIALSSVDPPQLMFLAENGTRLVVDEVLSGAGGSGLEHRLVAYDRSTGQLTARAQFPFAAVSDIAYRTITGAADATPQVIARYSSGLKAYDYGTDAWRSLDQQGDLPPTGRQFSEMAYDAATDRLLLYTRYDYGHSPGETEWGPRLYEYDFASSTWTRSPDPMIDIPISWNPSDKSHHFAFDEQARQTVAYFGDANAYGYDAVSHQFVDLDVPLPPNPQTPRFQPAVAYDSLNQRLIVASGYSGMTDMVALDPARRQWQELLAPVPAATPTPTAAPLACLGDPDDPGPIGQTRPDVGQLTFDQATGRIVATTGINDPTPGMWAFDVCGNSWYDLAIGLDAAPSLVTYQALSDDFLLVGGHLPADSPWRTYEISTIDLAGRVAELPQIPTGHAATFGIDRTLTNQTVLVDHALELWVFDASADGWAQLSETGDVPPQDGTAWGAAYDQSTDRLILYVVGPWNRNGTQAWPPRTYEFDFGSATWLRGEDPPDVSYGGWGFAGPLAYDAAHALTLLESEGGVVGYDSTQHQWLTLFEGPRDAGSVTRIAAPLVYDPINQRVVVAPSDGSMWAFDLDLRAWVNLLRPATP